MKALLRREPARLIALFVAVLQLATAFGISLSDVQNAAIVGLITAVITLIGGEATRDRVTPWNPTAEVSDGSE